MKKSSKEKKMIAIVLFLVVWVVSLTDGQAAEKTKGNQPVQQLPIIIQSDKIHVNDTSGEFYASGNVSVEQGEQSLFSEMIRGNSKLSTVWIDDKVTFLQPGTRIVGNSATYDYQERTGVINEAKGKVGQEFVGGHTIDILPDKVMIYNGTMTKCPAKVPDYHLSAERVEIWPGDKMIVYDAKFWIKNTIILSLPKYQQSLKKRDNSYMPSIGYDSGDGIYIQQPIGFPINDSLAFYSKLTYYSNAGFKPELSLEKTGKPYTLRLDYGEYRDDDDNWIRKEPTLTFGIGHKLGNLPVSYSFTAEYGKWTDDWKSSWHQGYNLYFSHDLINLGKGLKLNVGTGVEYIVESYDSSTQTRYRYDIGLSKTLSRKFDVWTSYHHVNNNSSIFNYDAVDVARELVPGITYRPDHLNTFTYYMSYDVANGSTYERYYVWNRNLHCWETTILYKQKEGKLTVQLHTANW